MKSEHRPISVHTVETYLSALTVREQSTLERERAPLNSLRDHNPKCLLSLDEDPPASYNGIRRLNVLDWLMDG